MGIEIVLYDSSPVVQKIFSHILYHYKPTVHRMDQVPKLLETIQHNRPDIIFLDDEFSEDEDLQAQIKDKQELKNIPIILMGTKEMGPKASSAKNFLKKPISAEQLRTLIHQFVPKTKTHILEKHLTFPALPDFSEEEELSVEEPVDLLSSVSSLGAMANEKKEDPSDFPSLKPVDEEPEEPAIGHLGEGTKNNAIDSIRTGVDSSPLSSKTEEEALSLDQVEEKAIEADEEDDGEEDGINPVTATQYKEVSLSQTNLSSPFSPDSEAESSVQAEESASVEGASKEGVKEDEEEGVEPSIQAFMEREGKEIAQKVAEKAVEKAVWEVVPELARQMVSSALDQLLKEEEMSQLEEESKATDTKNKSSSEE